MNFYSLSLFDLDRLIFFDLYTSTHHLLDDLRQRVLQVDGWLLHVTHIARLDTPLPPNCLSNTPSYQRIGIHTYVGLVRYGALTLYGWTD